MIFYLVIANSYIYLKLVLTYVHARNSMHPKISFMRKDHCTRAPQGLYCLVMVTINALQLFYLILRERKDVLMQCWYHSTSQEIPVFSKVPDLEFLMNRYLDSFSNFPTTKSATDIQSLVL